MNNTMVKIVVRIVRGVVTPTVREYRFFPKNISKLCVISFLLFTQVVLAQSPSELLQEFWSHKPKFFIVVGVNKNITDPNSDLLYIENDVRDIVKVLLSQGYISIAVLTNQNATRDKFVNALQELNDKPDDSIAVVYFSGHGEKDNLGNLWLQLYGQDKLGAFKGISASDVISTVRNTSYRGQLAFIIDSCYSGQAALKTPLSGELLKQISILTSSSESEESHKIDIDPNTRKSAFTYLLTRALTQDWEQTDSPSHDGTITFGELKIFIVKKLKELYKEGRLPGDMTPADFTTQSEMVTAVDINRMKNETNIIARFRLELFLDPSRLQGHVLVPDGQRLPSIEATSAASVVSRSAGPYTLALKAIAERRFVEAKLYLNEAEKRGEVDISKIYIARARAAFYEGQLDNAITWYSKIDTLRHQKKDYSVVAETAYAFQSNKDYVLAEKFYLNALKGLETISNARVAATYNYSTLLKKTGRYKQGLLVQEQSYYDNLNLNHNFNLELSPRRARLLNSIINAATASIKQ